MLALLVKLERESALSAVLSVLVVRQKDAGAADLLGTLFALSLELTVVVDLVQLERGHLDLDALVLDLLRRGVHLLLALSAATEKWVDDFDSTVVIEAELLECGLVRVELHAIR